MKKIICCLTFVVLLASCQDREETALTPNKSRQLREAASLFNDVDVQDGVLKFQDREHLRDVARNMEKEENLARFEGKSGFRSLLARQNSVTEADVDEIAKTRKLGDFTDLLVFRGSGDDVSLDPIVSDKRYAALFDENSIVIVGDSAYRVGFSVLTAIEIASNPEKLKRFKENPEMLGTTLTKVIRERKTVSNARTSGIQGDVITSKYRYQGDWYRFFAQFDRNSAAIYTSLAVKVRHQKRNFFIWYTYPTYRVGFRNGTGVYTVVGRAPDPFGFTIDWSGSQVVYNESEGVIFVDEVWDPNPYNPLYWNSGSAYADCQGLNGVVENFYFSP